MMYCTTHISKGVCLPPNITKMSILVRKQDKNSISYSLLVEQPQPLLDNDYILPNVIVEKAIILYFMMYCAQFSRGIFISIKIWPK